MKQLNINKYIRKDDGQIIDAASRNGVFGKIQTTANECIDEFGGELITTDKIENGAVTAAKLYDEYLKVEGGAIESDTHANYHLQLSPISVALYHDGIDGSEYYLKADSNGIQTIGHVKIGDSENTCDSVEITLSKTGITYTDGTNTYTKTWSDVINIMSPAEIDNRIMKAINTMLDTEHSGDSITMVDNSFTIV